MYSEEFTEVITWCLPSLVAELGGALTHKIPFDKKGVLLDSHDAHGKAQPQYIIKEETVVPIDMDNFKENEIVK